MLVGVDDGTDGRPVHFQAWERRQMDDRIGFMKTTAVAGERFEYLTVICKIKMKHGSVRSLQHFAEAYSEITRV